MFFNKDLNINGLGCKPNTPDSRDWEYKNLSLNNSNGYDLRRYIKVVGQGSSSSCVGHGIAGAYYIREKKKLGIGAVYPSRSFNYYTARKLNHLLVFDTGTSIRSGVKASVKFGICDETFWPFDLKKINRKPKPNAYFMGIHRKGGEYYTIKKTGDLRLDLIKSAIDEDLPVIFGTSIDEKWREGLSGYDLPTTNDKIIGKHCLIIIGYRITNIGLEFLILNSWDEDWGDKGLCWMTARYIAWKNSFDFTVIRGWDTLRSVA